VEPTAKKPEAYRPGVGVVLFNGAGRVWVGHRIAGPGQQFTKYWQMPQGGIDPEEDPVTAVFRELKEETGTGRAEIIAESRHWLCYDIPHTSQDVPWKHLYRGQRQKWFAMRFLGDDGDFHLSLHEHPEFDAWKWVDFHTLPSLAVPFKTALYEDIVAEFSHISEK
jgi:putative (di)nucleoside polyphosphate hydrolase